MGAQESLTHPLGESGPLVADYDSLRQAARGLLLRKAWDKRSLGPTDLVNEAVVRLLKDANVRGHADSRYAFAAVLRAMKRILIDRAKARKRLKRGGTWKRVSLDAVLDHVEEQNLDAVELTEAIERLAAWGGRQAEVVTLCYFFRMTVAEIAPRLEVSTSTVEGDLPFARAWLRRKLVGRDDEPLG